jgi:hypothetical protein
MPEPDRTGPPQSQARTSPVLYRHALQEVWVTLVVWFIALIWVVGYCYLKGYQHAADSWVVRNGLAEAHTPGEFKTILGFPEWAFYGVVVPWLCCTLFTIVYCGWFMHDDDLGAEQEEPHEV